MGGIVTGAVLFLGAGNASIGITTAVIVRAALTVASISYTAFSGYNSYKASKAARRRQLAQERRSSFLNFRDPIPYRRILYGEARVGGPILFAHSEPNNEVHLFIALSSTLVESIGDVYINDDIVPIDGNGDATGTYANVVTVHKILGNASPATLTPLRQKFIDEGIDDSVGGPISATDNFVGVAGLYVVLRRWSRKFSGEQPEFSAVVQGFNTILTGSLSDPGGYGFGYSNNPVECARAYMVNVMGIPISRFADASAAIAYCDELVTLKAGGTEKRYTCNGLVLADQTHEEVLEAFANSFAGAIRYVGGRWTITSKPTEDLSTVVSEDKMLGTYRFDYNRSVRALPKGIRGTYVDPSRNWQETEFPSLSVAGAALDHDSFLDLELLFTNSPSMAQRISKVFLYRARAVESVKVSMLPTSLRSIPGDVVTFQSDKLGKTVEMEVIDTSFTVEADVGGSLRVETTLGLQSYDSTAWDWDAATEEQDLAVGTTSLGGIFAKGPTEVTTFYRIVKLTSSAVRIDIDLSWRNPDFVPNGASLERTLYEIALEFTLRPTGGALDGSNDITVTKEKSNTFGTATEAGGLRPDYNDGINDLGLGVLQEKLYDNGEAIVFIYEWPAGHTFVRAATVDPTPRVRSVYSDDAKSEWVAASFNALTAPTSITTIEGIPMAEIDGDLIEIIY